MLHWEMQTEKRQALSATTDGNLARKLRLFNVCGSFRYQRLHLPLVSVFASQLGISLTASPRRAFSHNHYDYSGTPWYRGNGERYFINSKSGFQ